MEAKKILKDLVAINTIADKDNNRIMDYIDSFLSNLGFEIERKKNAETGKEVLIGKYGENPAIGFLGHTDISNMRFPIMPKAAKPVSIILVTGQVFLILAWDWGQLL